MSLYEEWNEITEKERSSEESDSFWNVYFEKEKNVYEVILGNHNQPITGVLGELAEKFNMDNTEFTGFIDGINSSLKHEYELDELNVESQILLDVDFEKLYFNMLEAKAEWLYNLPQWDEVLQQPQRRIITKEYNLSKMAVSAKIERNGPCTCGSGKKYKKCCGK